MSWVHHNGRQNSKFKWIKPKWEQKKEQTERREAYSRVLVISSSKSEKNRPKSEKKNENHSLKMIWSVLIISMVEQRLISNQAYDSIIEKNIVHCTAHTGDWRSPFGFNCFPDLFHVFFNYFQFISFSSLHYCFAIPGVQWLNCSRLYIYFQKINVLNIILS